MVGALSSDRLGIGAQCDLAGELRSHRSSANAASGGERSDTSLDQWLYAGHRSRHGAVVGRVDTTNLLHAADIWYSVKKHWCLEAQRLLRVGQDK
jgi:hypothetical protein